MKFSKSCLMVVGLMGLGGLAGAQGNPAGQGGQGRPGMEGGGPGQGERPHGPPPQALDACKGKAAGAVCSFTGRRGEKLTGSCFVPPARPATEGKTDPTAQGKPPMACRPDRGGPESRGQSGGPGSGPRN